jgi:hypothetical protein
MNTHKPDMLLTYKESYSGIDVMAEVQVNFNNSVNKLADILVTILASLNYYIVLGEYGLNTSADLNFIQKAHELPNAEDSTATFVIRVADANSATWYSAKETDMLVECNFYSGKIRLYKNFDTKAEVTEK